MQTNYWHTWICIQNSLFRTSNPSFIRSLKLAIGEQHDYENEIASYKRMNWNWRKHMTVVPVSFNKESLYEESIGRWLSRLKNQLELEAAGTGISTQNTM
jgi:hypothetical protein